MKGIKIRNIIGILIGTAIFSFGFVHFNMQNQLGEGGFSGITLILYFTLHWDPALLNLLLNIPMFIIGWRLLGKKSLIYTLIGTTSVSLFLKIFQLYEFQMNLQDDLLLVSLFAGVFVGLGLGIVFRFGGTTGGVDIVARLLHKYVGWSMGKTMFAFDAVVILLSWLTFLDARSMMYTLVAVYVGGRVIDFVQDGAYSAKGAIIISPHTNAIAAIIAEKMERGITLLEGHGYFTKEQKDVIYCVVGRNEIVRLKSIIHEVDPHAFVSILDVRDVAGEGFTLDDKKQPIH
ncbi:MULTISPECIES: YitT family protein [Bacillales]|uniref:YitT family protein n=1 Tax=Lysinibacillus louembei TaxID=1470088 RepID=A0ABZ0RXF3_9BACI|nr:MULTISPECIES: YitT family protein [Bacillales]MCT6923174.1 YitT family protein [Metasolibacillus sp.]MCT6939521.1 YitT family protein [Metasolibacillus sp.]WPK11706.1 YitT family protein [Lysinibacillus louembei]